MYYKFKFYFDENEIYLFLIYLWKYGGFFFNFDFLLKKKVLDNFF